MVIKCWVKSCSVKMDSKPLSFPCHLPHCWRDKGIFWLLLSSPAARCAATTAQAPGSHSLLDMQLQHVCSQAAALSHCWTPWPQYANTLLTSHCPFVLFFWSLHLTEDNGNFITDYSFITDLIRTKTLKPSLKRFLHFRNSLADWQTLT